jgi:hypothetical protein
MRHNACLHIPVRGSVGVRLIMAPVDREAGVNNTAAETPESEAPFSCLDGKELSKVARSPAAENVKLRLRLAGSTASCRVSVAEPTAAAVAEETEPAALEDDSGVSLESMRSIEMEDCRVTDSMAAGISRVSCNVKSS